MEIAVLQFTQSDAFALSTYLSLNHIQHSAASSEDFVFVHTLGGCGRAGEHAAAGCAELKAYRGAAFVPTVPEILNFVVVYLLLTEIPPISPRLFRIFFLVIV